ncbi:MAG: type II toxin-antitoxin system RelE family toxin [Gammaproteobacteria bacterium]
MNSYVVEVKPSARKELETLPDNVLARVVRKLEALGDTPRPAGCKS